LAHLGVRVKRCGKSAPRARRRVRHGKPHPEIAKRAKHWQPVNARALAQNTKKVPRPNTKKKQTLHTPSETGLPRNPPHQLGQNLDPNNTTHKKTLFTQQNLPLGDTTDRAATSEIPAPLSLPGEEEGEQGSDNTNDGFGWSRW
jgi:hypothetical protein